ncbi:MAG: hypothetical protein ACI87N_001566 [Flavobacteriales bacterium]|jgi:hypothetical protein
MFFFLRSCALTKFSIKLFVFLNQLVLSIFACLNRPNAIFLILFLIKMQKKFAQTNIYYKFALA